MKVINGISVKMKRFAMAYQRQYRGNGIMATRGGVMYRKTSCVAQQ